MTATPNLRPSPGDRRAGLRATSTFLAIPLFGLLAIEFILGMALALFVSLPSGQGVVSILSSSAVLDLHILIAVLIIGTSSRALVLSIRESARVPVYGSLIALISSIVATVAGWDFAFYGQAAGASFLMSMGFLGVLVGAFLLLIPGALRTTLAGSKGPPTGPNSAARETLESDGAP